MRQTQGQPLSMFPRSALNPESTLNRMKKNHSPAEKKGAYFENFSKPGIVKRNALHDDIPNNNAREQFSAKNPGSRNFAIKSALLPISATIERTERNENKAQRPNRT